MARWRTDPASALLAVAVLASGALLLALGSKLTFLLDDWTVLVYRRGFTEQAILDPHGEHILVVPVLAYKALLGIFGMGSAFPFRVVSTAMFLLSCVLLFVYLRRRVDERLALAGAVLVLFLGAAWEDLLWPFQVGFFASMVGGLGMLLALEREDRRGDRLACLLLVFSMMSSSVGIPFAIGGAVQILRDRDRWRRMYVVLVPLALYGLWWIGWGHTAESSVSLENLATTPLFVLNAVAAALASLLGLAVPVQGEGAGGLEWGRALVVASAVLVVWRLQRMGKVPHSLWVAVAIGGAFWILAGINEKPGREPGASRYQYLGVIFVLLIAAELLRGVRVGRGSLAVIAVVVVAAVMGNTNYLYQAYESYRFTSELEQADLAAVEIARDTVEPGFVLSEDIADTAYVHIEAGPYLSAVDEFGSPAYTPAELITAPEPARYAADKVLFNALQLVLVYGPVPAVAEKPARAATVGPDGLVTIPRDGCTAVVLGESSPLLRLPRGGVAIQAGGEPVTDIRMKRFAEDFPIDLEAGIAPGRGGTMRIPADGSTVPWKMQLDGEGVATACGLGREAG